MDAKQLEELLKKDIPISQAIGFKNLRVGSEKVQFDLPLKPNVNHKGTLFGGSLYSACALGSYALFLSQLRSASLHTNNIVISEGSMKYLSPVGTDCRVEATWVSAAEKKQFFKTLQIKKKARIQIEAKVLMVDQICAAFQGTFVAFID